MAWNPFDHHRGPFTFVLTRQRENPRKGMYPFACEPLPGDVSGADAEAEARALLADPRDSIISVAVWSVTEQQHIVTYRKEDLSKPLPVAAPIESTAPSVPAIVAPTPVVAPMPPVVAATPTPRREPKRTRGAQLVIGKTDGWPTSKGAQIVYQFFHPNRQATTHDVVGAVGEQLKAAGIEFPGSLISRLKQAGFLTEAA